MGYDLRIRDAPRLLGSKGWAHLSSWGMSALRALMDHLDVLDNEAVTPDIPDALEDAPEGVRATRSEKEGKVPAFKFSTLQRWIVVPEECVVLATVLESVKAEVVRGMGERYPDVEDFSERAEEVAEYAREFGDFCRRAADLGGFEVS